MGIIKTHGSQMRGVHSIDIVSSQLSVWAPLRKAVNIRLHIKNVTKQKGLTALRRTQMQPGGSLDLIQQEEYC